MSAKIQERLDAYTFFTDLFMTLPDERFARAALEFGIEADADAEMGPAKKAFSLFREGNAGKSIEDVLLELSVDRTQLVRGVDEDGIKPPYESLYTAGRAETSCLSLTESYKAAGLSISPDAKETPEFIGCEMGFMAELCNRQLEALEANDPMAVERLQQTQARFFSDHLGRWATAYAEAVVRFARTDFFRGIGYVLVDFLDEEAVFFAE